MPSTNDEMGTTQGGQPSDVPGGQPARLLEAIDNAEWKPPVEHGEFLDYEFEIHPYCRVSRELNQLMQSDSELKPDSISEVKPEGKI